MQASQRIWLRAGALVGCATLLLTGAARPVASAQEPVVTVYKSASCGCCSKWVEHLRAAGFTIKAVDVADMAEVKATLGVSPSLTSCHTAVVDGYVIEGHVPADVVRRFLKEHPTAVGLAVPGMPMGSPGMEGARKDAYNVVQWDKQGVTTIYARR